MKGNIMKTYEMMPNYLEYYELFETYTYEELCLAYDAIHNSEIQDELYASESTLLAFLIDTELQEKLNLYFEDIENDKERGVIFD
jgi:hypothetical protein